jgi:hypothetical protein
MESQGGNVHHDATLPELRLAVGEPKLNIGLVETVLEELVDASHYLEVERTATVFASRPT